MSEETTETMDTATADPIDAPSSGGEKSGANVTVMAILSIIGSSLWGIVWLLGVVAGNWLMSAMGLVDKVVEEAASQADVTAEEARMALEASSQGSEAMNMLANYFMVICLVMLAITILAILGAVKMIKMKKSGFIMYTIGTALYIILFVLGGTGQGLFLAAVSALFLVYFGMKLKHMS